MPPDPPGRRPGKGAGPGEEVPPGALGPLPPKRRAPLRPRQAGRAGRRRCRCGAFELAVVASLGVMSWQAFILLYADSLDSLPGFDILGARGRGVPAAGPERTAGPPDAARGGDNRIAAAPSVIDEELGEPSWEWPVCEARWEPVWPHADLRRPVGKRAGGAVFASGKDRMAARAAGWITHGQSKYAHMVTLEADRTLGTRVFAAWQASDDYEGVHSQEIRFAVSEDAGAKFKHTRTIATGQGKPVWGPVLHMDERDKLWVFYTRSNHNCTIPSRKDWHSPGGDILATTSTDFGRTWARPVVLLPHLAGRGEGEGPEPAPRVLANKLAVVRTHTGRKGWVLPFWTESRGSCGQKELDRAGLIGSLDHGRTWQEWGNTVRVNGTWLIENTVVPVSDDARLLQLFRTKAGNVFETKSVNGGRTWSDPLPTPLPNPDSKIHAWLFKDGTIGVAYNNSTVRGRRTPLFFSRSVNEGGSWAPPVVIEDDKNGEFSYPTGIQLENGNVLVAYTVASTSFGHFERHLVQYKGIRASVIPLNNPHFRLVRGRSPPIRDGGALLTLGDSSCMTPLQPTLTTDSDMKMAFTWKIAEGEGAPGPVEHRMVTLRGKEIEEANPSLQQLKAATEQLLTINLGFVKKKQPEKPREEPAEEEPAAQDGEAPFEGSEGSDGGSDGGRPDGETATPPDGQTGEPVVEAMEGGGLKDDGEAKVATVPQDGTPSARRSVLRLHPSSKLGSLGVPHDDALEPFVLLRSADGKVFARRAIKLGTAYTLSVSVQREDDLWDIPTQVRTTAESNKVVDEDFAMMWQLGRTFQDEADNTLREKGLAVTVELDGEQLGRVHIPRKHVTDVRFGCSKGKGEDFQIDWFLEETRFFRKQRTCREKVTADLLAETTAR